MKTWLVVLYLALAALSSALAGSIESSWSWVFSVFLGAIVVTAMHHAYAVGERAARQRIHPDTI